MPAVVGWLSLLFLAVSYLQLSGLPFGWFWTFNGNTYVFDDAVLCAFLFLSSATSVMALTVLSIEGFFRDYRQISERLASDFAEESRIAVGAALRAAIRFDRVVRFVVVASIFAMVVVSALGVVRLEDRGKLAAIRDYVRETVRECEGADYVFTDGSMDVGLRLESAARGRVLRPLSLISGPTARDRAIRVGSAEDEHDRELLSDGGARVLKDWFVFRTNRLNRCAVQIGFELWSRNQRPLPTCSGLVARPGGLSDEERLRGISAADVLAE